MPFGQYTSFRDALDGGGAGRSGPTFEGGPLSGLLNTIGVRPLGYRDRQQEPAPMPRPAPRPRPAQPMQYSGRGDAGMPMQYSGRGDAGMPMGQNPVTPYDEASRFLQQGLLAQPTYSGRGYVGMPMESIYANDPMYSDTLAYLRSLGLANY